MPDGFGWGVATASYQIEGSLDIDGRGPSIWDTFERKPGAIKDGSSARVANDHYRRWTEDLESLSRLNVDYYRFSIAWPRIQPDGVGSTNRRGLDFYSRLIDGLLERDIQPWITLYHWDLPQALEDAGGWPERDTALRFADYAELVFEALKDRVERWSTLNEPYCAAFHGYASGKHAPGRDEPDAALAAAHHLLLGHGLAVERMREAGSGHQFGITINLTPIEAASHEPADQDAARRVDGIANRWFLDPVLRGAYPADIATDLDDLIAPDLVMDGDLETIHQPLDFFGLNYYMRHKVGAGSGQRVASGTTYIGAADATFHSRGLPTTDMGWEIDPEGLAATVESLVSEYDMPTIWITENGAAFADVVDSEGRIVDTDRIGYLWEHLRALRATIDQGADIGGYFAWTLNDNFEWAFGLSKRFGLIYYDYDQGRRIFKDSGNWFSDVAEGNTLISPESWTQRSGDSK